MVRDNSLTALQKYYFLFVFYLSAALFQFSYQFLFGGQVEFVFGGEQMVVVVHHRVPDNGVVPLGAKYDPDGRVVRLRAHVLLEITGVEVYLSDVLVGDLADFR